MGLCEVGRGGSLREGRQIRESRLRSRKEVGDCEGFCDWGTPCLRKCKCFLRVPVRAMDVQVSHDDAVMILKTLSFLSHLVH